MKWYKKQLDAIQKENDKKKPKEDNQTDESQGKHATLRKHPRRVNLPNGLEKRSRPKTDLY